MFKIIRIRVADKLERAHKNAWVVCNGIEVLFMHSVVQSQKAVYTAYKYADTAF